MISDISFRLRALFRRNKTESELAAELNTHLEYAIEKNIKAGMTVDKARRRAAIEFGGLDQIREECRDARGLGLIETLFQDVRYGLRMMRKYPTFTAIAILTLALGIGASTTVFSVVNTALLKPLPYKNPERIMNLARRAPRSSQYYELGDLQWAQREFRTYHDMSTVFQGIAAFKADTFNLTGSGQPALLEGVHATGDFFNILGVHPILGRTFTPADLPDNENVVVLSHRLWRDRFGQDSQIIGKKINLNGIAHTVIGVMPADF